MIRKGSAAPSLSPDVPPGPLQSETNRCREGFRLIVDGSDDVFFYEHDEEYRFTFLSASVETVTGFDVADLIGRRYEALLVGDGSSRTAETCTRRALETGARQNSYHVNARHRDGRTIVLEILESPLVRADGTMSIHGFARDVTAKRAAEVALRHRLESEAVLARISALLNAPESPDLNEVLRMMGELADVSRAYVFLARADDRIDNTHEWCADGVTPQIENLQDLPADLFPWWMKRLRRGHTIRIADVSDLPGEAHRERETLEAQDIRSVLVVPLTGAGGELLGFIGFDDTCSTRIWKEDDVRVLKVAAEMVAGDLQRRRSKEALRQREEYFRALIEDAPSLIMVLDTGGIARYASPSYREILGYAPGDLEGTPILEKVHPEDRLRVEEELEDLVQESGRSSYLEARVRHADGSWRVLRGAVKNLLDQPSVGGLVVNAQDVTERQLLEAKFEQAQRVHMVGRLAGGVAHDINNVLTAIGGYTSFLQEALPEGHPLCSDVEEIARAKGRAAGIVEQLLTFSRRDMAEVEVLDLNDVVGGIERMLERLIGEDVQISVAPASGRATIRADRTQIEQVLVNLAVNARDAMPGGGMLSIEVEGVPLNPKNAEGGAEDDYVLLTVSDTGEGISPEVWDRLFEPFFTTKPPGKGLGLGLATVQGIVERVGGHLAVESELGCGTTFRIHLPAASGRPAVVERCPTVEMSGDGLVLLVEDDPAVRAVARRILVGAGYEVVEAEDGRGALEWVQQLGQFPDVVITDTVMPEIGGFELARRLRELRPDMDILFMSGYTVEEMGRNGDRPTESHFLRKPFEPADLLAKVGSLVKVEAGRH